MTILCPASTKLSRKVTLHTMGNRMQVSHISDDLHHLEFFQLLRQEIQQKTLLDLNRIKSSVV